MSSEKAASQDGAIEIDIHEESVKKKAKTTVQKPEADEKPGKD
jgi:hypothetical protein